MKIYKLAFTLLLVSVMFTSCIKQSYDNPPDSTQIDPKIPTNVTIKQLTDYINAKGNGAYVTIVGDSTIYGVVTADDRSGNFYKQIIIQDSTGGLSLSLAQYSLFNDYPQGRRVYVNLKGLTLINYKGVPTVCFGVSTTGSLSVTGIPSALIINYITKGKFPDTSIKPLLVRCSDIVSNYQKYTNILVKIENMQFDTTGYSSQADTNLKKYAEPSIFKSGTNKTVHDCPLLASVIMYNSGYATFQPANVPIGNGTITCISSTYNQTPQILIRDTTDIQFTNPRTCP